MLHGIDISNWQDGIKLANLTRDIDFVIYKSTEGLGYTDPCFWDFRAQASDVGLLQGFYHFARENEPEDEAEFFYSQAHDLFGKGIPVLDYETENYDNCEWCERFLKRLHDISGVWAVLYISAYRCSQYEGSWIPETCGLWLAGYPYNAVFFNDDEMPYDISPWQICAIWQFTSSLYLNGYDGRLDGNVAYMDSEAWLKYAHCEPADSGEFPPVQPLLSYTELAKDVMRGNWSTGAERMKLVQNAGYDYDTLQETLNQYYVLANDIIYGKWGNGWNRKTALEGAGYDYELAQMCVNALLEDSE